MEEYEKVIIEIAAVKVRRPHQVGPLSPTHGML
jgi:hypothetical protein